MDDEEEKLNELRGVHKAGKTALFVRQCCLWRRDRMPSGEFAMSKRRGAVSPLGHKRILLISKICIPINLCSSKETIPVDYLYRVRVGINRKSRVFPT